MPTDILSRAGLPEAWAGQAQWRVLDTGFGHGERFIALWRAWRDDPRRPGLLHVVAVQPFPDPASTLSASGDPLARELAAAWWGLTPGLHRLTFEGGRVILTLCVGPAPDLLRELAFAADTVLLTTPHPDAATLKAVARHCRRGTRFALQPGTADERALAPHGFVLSPEGRDGMWDPAWTPRHPPPPSPATPSDVAVVGAGLAGASAAAALARRGWRVTVLDAAAEPASGASALPAGLMAPHLSPDDNLLSRLSRHGLRETLHQARALLREGEDWQGGGTLEHRVRGKPARLQAEGFAADWSRAATPGECLSAGLPPGAAAVWHGPAGWIRPGALVRAWLSQPGVTWRGNARVDRLVQAAGGWQALDADGQVLAAAPLVVVAAALGSAPLAGNRLWLQPVRGQVSWAPRETGIALPACPVNGNGHLLPDVPIAGQRAWISGSSYGRGETATDLRPADHAANLQRLEALLPDAARALAPAFATGRVRGWAGVRCASADRRPLVGELAPGLWVSTAMGSRGLTFAALCAQLLAGRLHGEPLPLPLSLAAALDVARQAGRRPA